jgi:flagellar basal-body rod modification protein FlgD
VIAFTHTVHSGFEYLKGRTAMDLFGSNSITAASTAAKAKVVAGLLPRSVGDLATRAVASSSGSTAAKSKSAGTITSSDFLTLLVSELKNQDPTQPTDPNAYIQQLVGVNSLQQLIQINQGLTTIEPVSGTAGPSNAV